MALYGGIEAGGTKFVCVVGSGPDDIRYRERIDTTDPETTLAAAMAALDRGSEEHGGIDAIGIASFGPLELRPDHPRYGWITTTPKPGWADTDFVGPISNAFKVPVGFDTDVNGAALAEWRWGAAQGLETVVYVTVGTGIGGGGVIDGKPLHGLVHPEMGHLSVDRQDGDDYPGHCPYHRDCLEGMAAGPAIAERFARPADELGDLTGWATELMSGYLAAGLRQVVYTLAPHRIVLGGGVASLPGLVHQVGQRLSEELAGYGVQPEHEADFVVPPGLGSDSGVAGALALAKAAAEGP